MGNPSLGRENPELGARIRRLVMESATASTKSKHAFLLLAFIFTVLYLLHSRIFHKLLINHHDALRVKRWPHLPLRFRDDGTFKILQVADVHFGNGMATRCRDVLPDEFDWCSDLNSTRFLTRMIRAEKPDFVAFTGDNIFGGSATDAAESLFQVFRPVIESGIPWAAVLGNHDQESTMTRQELMHFMSLMDYSLSELNPPAANGGIMSQIDGFGNYNLGIFGAPGSHFANTSILNLYFLDSGDREIVQGIKTYGWIKESQLNWIRGVSERFQGQTQNMEIKDFSSPKTTPALAFFHIPIPEVRQLYYQRFKGQFQEGVACSIVNSGVLHTFVSMGDVKAAFIGHDHKNDFCGNLEGIWFCYGGGFGYHGYGRAGWPRRSRIIQAELEKSDNGWMGVTRIKTWKRLDDEKLSKIDDQVLWEV